MSAIVGSSRVEQDLGGDGDEKAQEHADLGGPLAQPQAPRVGREGAEEEDVGGAQPGRREPRAPVGELEREHVAGLARSTA